MQQPFHGSIVALPTPFVGGRIDLPTLGRWVREQKRAGTHAVLACGTTGETATLSLAEQDAIIAEVLTHAGGMNVMVGVGSNDTQATVNRARAVSAMRAADRGVCGLLVVTPYYSRPSRAGLDLHFGAVAESVDLPIVLYNVPNRTGVDLCPTQARALAARHRNIVAIKETVTGRDRLGELRADQHLALFCGEDSAIRAFMGAGAVAAVNVTGNIAPTAMARLIAACARGGNPQQARTLEQGLAGLVQAMFVETNPVPVKAALAMLGNAKACVRAPLADLEADSRAEVQAALHAAREVVGLRPSKVST